MLQRCTLWQYVELLQEISIDDLVTFFIYALEMRMILLDRLSRQHGRLVFVYEIKVRRTERAPQGTTP